MTITIFSLFPEYFQSVLRTSIIKRAQAKQSVNFELINIRDFAVDKHRLTDDRPFGGGAGMVMMIEPIDKALRDWQTKYQDQSKLVVATSASGKLFTQQLACHWAQLDHLAILCGHYEGIDQRVLDHLVDTTVRIGDYVLSGGEPAAAVILDTVTRLLPGALGNEHSLVGEAHEQPGQGSYPQYTRPAEYKTWKVPDILLNGNHAKIEAWRQQHRQKI
ncbi:MAG: tRNA (guanosine(37)-N1)-methyltransferase TrmD [Candidatus Pacebacteria bacterium CG_4_10_14_0_8_um_filter_43_12]|nr:MAG: tRNA (guanosine(37)-N1)-methyltransferase TrmD [Candidatus Pacebacteria bacterium CG10_big_fil_rev_8_21_14_0_10_44_11]PIY79872.1 MAG: tRNA (guanosine(37)-N1)-methyltransferase TrmD [Candidatus Pacebacteria bacterium CG_4_10_14_0_8_um_filter_43_12]